MMWHVCGMGLAFRSLAAWLAIALYAFDLRGNVARLEGLEPPAGCLEDRGLSSS